MAEKEEQNRNKRGGRKIEQLTLKEKRKKKKEKNFPEMTYSGRLKKPVRKIKYNSYGLCLTYQLPGTAHNKVIKNTGTY